MPAKATIAAGVAGGYVLGRTKKFRLALTLGSLLAGQKLRSHRDGLMSQGNKLLDSNPQLQELRDQVSGRLMQMAREAAMTAAATRVESITRSLQGGSAGDDRDEAADEDVQDEDLPDEEPETDEEEDAGDEDAEEKDVQDEDVQDEDADSAEDEGASAEASDEEDSAEEEEPARPARKRSTSSAGAAKRPAKKPAKKTATKAPTAKSTSAKKSTSRATSGGSRSRAGR